MRQRPGDFLHDAAFVGGWDIGGVIWSRNPLIDVPHTIFSVVDLWLAARAHGTPMGGRSLPCSGAIGEQPAALMDAFLLLDSWTREQA